tara:strand:+ start:249 stop:1037 length:789 start_codon:yes stop_codon:yes gene_type:complete
MPTVEILKSHSVKTLRDEIAKTNAKLDVIKGYSKDMKKAQIIELMMKHKNRFHHIKIAEKTVRAPPLKSETAKKISKPAQQPAQHPTVIAPKKRVAKTATVIAPKKEKKIKEPKKETIKNDHADFSSLEIQKENIYYEDEKQNIFIWLFKTRKDALYIDELNGYFDPDKKRAKKGLTRKVLCEIINHLLNIDEINKSTLITLTPGDLGVLQDKFDMKKLKAMYESMGFKKITSNKMGMDIKSFMKWCDSKYGGNFLDKWADK